MSNHFPLLKNIFTRTEEALKVFMEVLEPTIENAKDEHERLYFHHIYEEEEHRQDRLTVLNPKLDYFIEHNDAADRSNHEFIRLLQDISLEKFGLHNFLEHLDLALFQFKDTEYEPSLQSLRDMTNEDYQAIKSLLNELNDQFEGAANSAASIPTDEKEHVAKHLKVDKYINDPVTQSSLTSSITIASQKKKLTVGSLKGGDQ
ncbi:IMEF encapsulin system ferritin-like cargo protein [Alkalihalobacillus sp. AL-G]|uniref:IMEF encapsulin system ferritin-like cargo protein n=1 Tax=Alkalihalobacillus sp. AL-G TaxID=2926399 RepID=UPI00272AD7E3|nr:IMEF encapsulin system ferritin-like cargo protein [Alkalihalobacillus sp. AL-G]WLD91959.1 hypothetical protein MOJ78_13040 [Alkalihalobacillus sp. AL-G]